MKQMGLRAARHAKRARSGAHNCSRLRGARVTSGSDTLSGLAKRPIAVAECGVIAGYERARRCL